MRSFIFLLVFIVVGSGCYRPKDGCLDTEAVNFDVSADNDCCCAYPQIRITLSPSYNTKFWQPDSTFVTSQNETFKLLKMVFYLSDFEIFQNGKSFKGRDTLRARVFELNSNSESDVVLKDDIMLFRYPTYSYDLGELRTFGSFTKAQIRFGLNDTVRRVVPTSLRAGHPLRPQSDYLWWGRSKGYVVARFQILANGDTTTFNLLTDNVDDVVLSTNGSFKHQMGTNLDLTLGLALEKLFEGITWADSDTTAWKQQIVANLPNAFTFSQ